jgi:hypothetical protein
MSDVGGESVPEGSPARTLESRRAARAMKTLGLRYAAADTLTIRRRRQGPNFT